MKVYNCSHVLTDVQKEQLGVLLEDSVDEHVIRVQLDLQQPFAEQLQEVIREICKDQSRRYALIPPSLGPAAALVAGALSWIGEYPPIVRLAPRANTPLVIWDVKELVRALDCIPGDLM
jgi:hypothetical protein